jgi:hypothetical protein
MVVLTKFFFSSQFDSDEQATAKGLETAMDNLMSGLARGIFARCFDPNARGLAAANPLIARAMLTLLCSAVWIYSWAKFRGRTAHSNGHGKEE